METEIRRDLIVKRLTCSEATVCNGCMLPKNGPVYIGATMGCAAHSGDQLQLENV